jgi:hypothetical protein
MCFDIGRNASSPWFTAPVPAMGPTQQPPLGHAYAYARTLCHRTKLHTRPVATGVFFLTRFFHNFLKNDAQDLKKWSRKTHPAFLYNL